MKINLKYFGQIAELMNCEHTSLYINEEINTLFKIRDKLILEHPKLRTVSFKIAVNSSLTQVDIKLKENDEISFFPPFSGG